MFRKAIIIISFIVLFCVSADAPANLVAHWKLDGGSGTIAHDSTGKGNDGVFQGNPQWVDGKIGRALEFDGDDYLDCGNPNMLDFGTNDWTITAWMTTTSPEKDTIFAKGGDGTGGKRFTLQINEGNATRPTLTVDDDVTKVQAKGTTVVIDGLWYHLAAMREGTAISIYINGVLEGTNTLPAGYDLSGVSQHNAYIGTITDNPSDSLVKFHIGTIDDVRLYNHALSEDELLAVMEGAGAGFPFSRNPQPPDGAVHEDTWANLSWTAGDSAVSHDVYIGESFDDVNNATNGSQMFRGNQTATFYVAGFPGNAYPDGLTPGTTYYWRIDEVNEADPNSPWKGTVWSVSIPPRTAYGPDPADGAEFVGPDNVTLSWVPGLGAKLHTVYLGDDSDGVNDATTGIPTGNTSYDPGTLEREKVYYWRVDESDGIAAYKGDIWAFTTAGAAGAPQPANGAADVPHNPILTWTPAGSASSHDLYFGTDRNTLKNATTGSPEYKGNKALGSESYDPGQLAWDTSYYWRVDAVYSNDPAKPVKGLVWNFTTSDFLVVDDFETYTDDDTAGQAIWQAWIDGFGITDNGAQVGYLLPPYCEQTIVHGGIQSMPLLYNNEMGVMNSAAMLTLKAPRDWTAGGIGELSLWFRGASANAAEPLYVEVSNNIGSPAIAVHDDPAAAANHSWTQWRIPLQTFADQGIDLSNVDKFSIGLGSKGRVSAGGTGTIYIDDIRLYRTSTP